jgi:hypothetical protein
MSTPNTNNRTTARDRELQALSAVASMGWLITSHVGDWVYYDCKNKHVATNKAQETLKRLELKGLVFNRKDDPDNHRGYSIWVLTKNGADFINEYFRAQNIRPYAHHGYDLGLLDQSYMIRLAEHLGDKLKAGAVGAGGPAAIRAGLGGTDVKDCTGFYYVDNPFRKGTYTVTGVFSVSSARESTLAIHKRIAKTTIALDLLGDPLILAALRRRIRDVDSRTP